MVYMTPDEAAEYFRVSRAVILKRCREGILPCDNVGTDKKPRWRIQVKSLPCMIRNRRGVVSKFGDVIEFIK